MVTNFVVIRRILSKNTLKLRRFDVLNDGLLYFCFEDIIDKKLNYYFYVFYVVLKNRVLVKPLPRFRFVGLFKFKGLVLRGKMKKEKF